MASNKTYSRIQRTFCCPICDTILCSKGATKNSKSATVHFKMRHPKYTSKTHCLVCLKKNPSAKHKVNCLKQTNLKKKKESNVVLYSEADQEVHRKTILMNISTLLMKRIASSTNQVTVMIEADVRNLIENFELVTYLPIFKKEERGFNFFFQGFELFPKLNLNTQFFQNYLEMCYLKADPSSSMGLAIQTLVCFEENKYVHLIICYELLSQFKDLCDSNVIRPTQFYCFCTSMNPIKGKSIERILHMHLLAYVPNMEEFKKRIWNKLTVHKKIRYKSSHKVKNIQHFYHLIIYLSQQKACSSDYTNCSNFKHFSMNTLLSPTQELKLSLIIPAIALQFISHYSKMVHFAHYDIYRFSKNDFRSELSDVLSQIDIFHYLVSPEEEEIIIPDLKNEQLRLLKQSTTVREILFIFLTGEENRYHFIQWKGKKAKEFCKTLFQVKSIPKHNSTLKVFIKFKNEKGKYEMKYGDSKVTTSNDIKVLEGFIEKTALTQNVHLVGVGKDIQMIKRSMKGFLCDENSFSVFSNNMFYTFQYTITDNSNILEEDYSSLNEDRMNYINFS